MRFLSYEHTYIQGRMEDYLGSQFKDYVTECRWREYFHKENTNHFENCLWYKEEWYRHGLTDINNAVWKCRGDDRD